MPRSQAAFSYWVGIPELITWDFDPDLTPPGAPLLLRCFDIEMPLRTAKRERVGDQLAALSGMYRKYKRLFRVFMSSHIGIYRPLSCWDGALGGISRRRFLHSSA